MRLSFLCLLLLSGPLVAQGPGSRFGISSEPKTYPQATPQEAFASLLKAIGEKRVDYLLAQLADPQFVDARTEASAGGFADLVRETTEKLITDPGALRQLKRLSSEGKWKLEGDRATLALDAGPDQSVFFRRIEGRWVLENAYRLKPSPRRRG